MKLAKSFISELDIRRTLKDHAKDKIFWIEPSAGSTMGLPDCFIASDAGAMFCELKIGILTRKGVLTFAVRREQRTTLKRMVRLKIDVRIIVGIKGTRALFMLLPDQKGDWLSGRVHLNNGLHKKTIHAININTMKNRSELVLH